MYPDDRVLIGVVNRKKDLEYLLKGHWYRIPQKQMPKGIYTEYIAFFLSGTAAKRFGESGVYYYAARQGVELRYRKDLLPNEKSKKAVARANDVYYKIQFRQIEGKVPAILNPTGRRFSFIFSTWDRFINAAKIADLYSDADYYVDRIYHALRDQNIRIDRYWDAQRKETGHGANVRIICESGILTGYTDTEFDDQNGLYLDSSQNEDSILAEIKAKIAQLGGPLTLPLGTTY